MDILNNSCNKVNFLLNASYSTISIYQNDTLTPIRRGAGTVEIILETIAIISRNHLAAAFLEKNTGLVFKGLSYPCAWNLSYNQWQQNLYLRRKSFRD